MTNSLKIIKTTEQMQEFVLAEKLCQHSIALVPTMGNLHEGHLALVSAALSAADTTIVSIFVNPLQFSAHEDFHTYPRTEEQDLLLLENMGVSAVFMPAAEEMHPMKNGFCVKPPTDLNNQLCAIQRPHFFEGVTTVVLKLFNICQPTVAVFGEKDFQQLRIIEQMVYDLHLNVMIHRVPCIRSKTGIALSSRNQYLSSSELGVIQVLHDTLSMIKNELEAGHLNFKALIQRGLSAITESRMTVDYLEIRNPDSLLGSTQNDAEFVVLVAARYAGVRFIDNMQAGNPA